MYTLFYLGTRLCSKHQVITCAELMEPNLCFFSRFSVGRTPTSRRRRRPSAKRAAGGAWSTSRTGRLAKRAGWRSVWPRACRRAVRVTAAGPTGSRSTICSGSNRFTAAAMTASACRRHRQFSVLHQPAGPRYRGPSGRRSARPRSRCSTPYTTNAVTRRRAPTIGPSISPFDDWSPTTTTTTGSTWRGWRTETVVRQHRSTWPSPTETSASVLEVRSQRCREQFSFLFFFVSCSIPTRESLVWDPSPGPDWAGGTLGKSQKRFNHLYEWRGFFAIINWFKLKFKRRVEIRQN